MAAGTFTLYSKNKDDIKLDDLVGATVKAMLVTSTYAPNTDVSTGHYLLTDITNEIANGNGYTTGGQALTGAAKTAITGGFKYTSNEVSWTATGGSIPAWRYAVFYVSGSLWGMTNPLIGYFVGDSTPADVPATTVTNQLKLAAPSGGWFQLI